MTLRPLEIQEAIYAAEQQALSSLGLRWSKISEVRQYVDEVMTSDYWMNAYPLRLDVTVERLPKSSGWAATCNPEFCVIRIAQLDEYIVLHELAHLAAGPDHGHDKEFIGIFVDLIRERMGFHAYGALLYAFKQAGLFDL